MRYLPLAGLLVLARWTAATPAQAANADCFCARAIANSGSVKPYEVVRLNKASCKDVPYYSHGKPPWQNGVPACKNQGASTKPASKPSTPAATDELMRRCFCTKHVSGNGVQQYKVVSCATVPECKGLTYQPKGQGPWENTLTCGYAEACKENTKRCKKDLDKATKMLSDKDPLKATRAQNEIVNISKRCQVIENDCYINPQK